MSIEQHLRSTCEFAIVIARRGLEANPEVSPPATLRSYLYQTPVPDRAISVAYETLENDYQFRKRVAAAASKEDVGDLGWLWLKRPRGWKKKFEAQVDELDPKPQKSKSRTSRISELFGDGDQVPPTPPSDFEMPKETPTIESELSNLRGLVDRLADEREFASEGETKKTSVVHFLPEEEEEEGVIGVASELSESDASKAVISESAQISQTLNRQLQLEKELADLRDANRALESEVAELKATKEASAVDSKASKQELGRISDEAAELRAKKEELEAATEDLKEANAALTVERDEAVAALEEIREASGGVDVKTLHSDNKVLADAVFATETELETLRPKISELTQELSNSKTELESLRADKSSLSLKLSELESKSVTDSSALEGERTQVKDLRTQVNDLVEQLDTVQSDLAEALRSVAKARGEADQDRDAFRRMREERDALLTRIAEVEQVDHSTQRTLQETVAERDELLSLKNKLVSEKGKLKGETAAAQRQSDHLNARLQMLQDKLEPLEAAMIGERSRVEELSASLEKAHADRQRIEDEVELLRSASQGSSKPGVQASPRDSVLNQRIAEVEETYRSQTQHFESQLRELKGQLNKSEQARAQLQQELAEGASEVQSLSDVSAAPLGPVTKEQNRAAAPASPQPIDEAPKSPIVERQAPTHKDPLIDTTVHSVWSQDWPPGSEDDFGDFDLGSNGSLSDFEPHQPTESDTRPASSFPEVEALDDLDELDEVSELISRTVTDFKAIDVETDFESPSFLSGDGVWAPGHSGAGPSQGKPTESPVAQIEKAFSAPDVVVLVDGDGAAGLGWGQLSLEEQRSSLVSFLAHISELYGAAIQIVFDGKLGGQNSLPHSRSVRIRLSHPPLTTEKVIGDLLDTFPDHWPKAVVTDSPVARKQAERMRAQVFSAESLLDFINMIATSS